MLAQEKELKEHPERNRVKTVTMTAEELYEKIMKNGGSYDIEGGILALKMAVDEEKKEKYSTINSNRSIPPLCSCRRHLLLLSVCPPISPI